MKIKDQKIDANNPKSMIFESVYLLRIDFKHFSTTKSGDIQIAIGVNGHPIRNKARIFTVFTEINHNTLVG